MAQKRAVELLYPFQNYTHWFANVNNLNQEVLKESKEFNESLVDESLSDEQKEENLKYLEAKIKNFEKQVALGHILPRVIKSAQIQLLNSQSFVDLFLHGKNVDCVVVSIDIRKSTELMLRARTPEKYAEFIIDLSNCLKSLIIENYGIFDKFTGDGILSFFPDFYSGEDSMRYALRAAKACHDVFKKLYFQNKGIFNVVMKDIGLGIGIDYGSVSLVNSQGELTVVGIPVVYACRMSSAPAGKTLLNQPAMEHIIERYQAFAIVEETKIEIKNEGIVIAYTVTLDEKLYETISIPDWDEKSQGSDSESN